MPSRGRLCGCSAFCVCVCVCAARRTGEVAAELLHVAVEDVGGGKLDEHAHDGAGQGKLGRLNVLLVQAGLFVCQLGAVVRVHTERLPRRQERHG